jgi:hypothetical protein
MRFRMEMKCCWCLRLQVGSAMPSGAEARNQNAARMERWKHCATQNLIEKRRIRWTAILKGRFLADAWLWNMRAKPLGMTEI